MKGEGSRAGWESEKMRLVSAGVTLDVYNKTLLKSDHCLPVWLSQVLGAQVSSQVSHIDGANIIFSIF